MNCAAWWKKLTVKSGINSHSLPLPARPCLLACLLSATILFVFNPYTDRETIDNVISRRQPFAVEHVVLTHELDTLLFLAEQGLLAQTLIPALDAIKLLIGFVPPRELDSRTEFDADAQAVRDIHALLRTLAPDLNAFRALQPRTPLGASTPSPDSPSL